MSQFNLTELDYLKLRIMNTVPTAGINAGIKSVPELNRNAPGYIEKTNQPFFDQFVLYDNYNRDLVRTQYIKLMENIKRDGYLVEIPILVTPKNNLVKPGFYVILDGQHRFIACSILNCKFTVSIVDGVFTHKDILSKISLYNTDQRDLNLQDFGKLQGDNVFYGVMKHLVLTTGLTENIMLRIINKNNKDYKSGNFELSDKDYDNIKKVSKINDVLKTAAMKRLRSPNSYAKAISKILQDENVNEQSLKRKIQTSSVKLITNGNENQKIIDLYKIYNYGIIGSKTRITIPEKFTRLIK